MARSRDRVSGGHVAADRGPGRYLICTRAAIAAHTGCVMSSSAVCPRRARRPLRGPSPALDPCPSKLRREPAIRDAAPQCDSDFPGSDVDGRWLKPDGSCLTFDAAAPTTSCYAFDSVEVVTEADQPARVSVAARDDGSDTRSRDKPNARASAPPTAPATPVTGKALVSAPFIATVGNAEGDGAGVVCL